ncbi:MAG: hypothetical protein ABJB74_08770 [Gemmatimonas sp.]
MINRTVGLKTLSPLFALFAICATPTAVFSQAKWQLSAKPTLTIGDEASEKTQFLNVRATMRASDGSVTVLNWGTRELRQFNATGAFIKSYGREGAGPGEFRNMTPSARYADTLFISDSQLNRLTRFVIGKGFVGSSVLQPTVGPVTIIERLRNGDMFVHETRYTSMEHPNGIFQDSLRLGVMTISPSPTVRWIGNFNGWSHLAVNPKNAERAQSVGIYQFAGNLMMAASGNEMIVGRTDSPELSVFAANGTLIRKFRLAIEQRSFNEANFARAKVDDVAKMKTPASVEAVTERYNLKYRPKYEPLYAQLLTAMDGTLWVQRFRYSDKDPTEYLVVDPNGKALANITVPPGVALQEIGANYILGVSKDDDGVESVVMYSILK